MIACKKTARTDKKTAMTALKNKAMTASKNTITIKL
jgi:hypothetical protein